MLPTDTPKIKKLRDAGIPVAEAVKASLGMTVREFADKHGVPETGVSGVINGSTPHPYNNIRDALCAELGVDREWLDSQLPTPKAA